MKRNVSLLFVFTLFLTSLILFRAGAENDKKPQRILPTYYAYSSKETASLENLSSNTIMSEKELQKWDEITIATLVNHQIPTPETGRVYAYLYVAQRDAAFLSYNSHNHFEGSLDPISKEILTLFFPDFTPPENYTSDPYSEELAAIVFPKFKERYERENALDMRFVLEGGGGYQGSIPLYLAEIDSWIPWLVKPATIYRPAAPPPIDSPIWNQQIAEVKKAQKNLSAQQIEAIRFWAGLTGPESGDWRKVANDYFFHNNVPFAKIILVRSVLAMGNYDANIACFDAKYHYSVMRPVMRDATLIPLISMPPHPSYPSGHATGSKTAEVILTYYFPEEKKEWNALAEEAGLSRIWAGIHYPIDNEAGMKLGKTIGDQVIIEENLLEEERENV